MPGGETRSHGDAVPASAGRARPTASGWVSLAAGAAAFAGACVLGRVDLLVFALFLLLVPLGSLLALTLDRPRIELHRQLEPATVAAGSEFSVAIELRNLANRATAAMSWADAGGAALRLPGPEPLPPLGELTRASRDRSDRARLRYRAVATRRGVYPIGPLTLIRKDPFGLAVTGYRIGSTATVTVTPRVFPLGDAGLGPTRSEGLDHELTRHSIPSADELSAREYRPGDPLRRVHWRATARHDTLMVRQEEERSSPESWLVLDASADRPGGGTLERRVELVASIAAHLMGLRFTVGLVEAATVKPGRAANPQGGIGAAAVYDPDALPPLLTDLAALRPGSVASRSRWAAALATGAGRSRSSVPVFVVLDRLADADAEALIRLRGLCEPAVCFLFGEGDERAEVLRRGGWICVPVGQGIPADTAWARAAERAELGS